MDCLEDGFGFKGRAVKSGNDVLDKLLVQLLGGEAIPTLS